MYRTSVLSWNNDLDMISLQLILVCSDYFL